MGMIIADSVSQFMFLTHGEGSSLCTAVISLAGLVRVEQDGKYEHNSRLEGTVKTRGNNTILEILQAQLPFYI